MQEIENFDIGDKVKHPKFGTGTVMFRTGEGEMQKLTVKFGSDVGEKKLLASLAKLKLISERPTLAPEAATAPVEAVPGRTKLAKADDDEDEDEDEEEVEVEADDDDDEEVEVEVEADDADVEVDEDDDDDDSDDDDDEDEE